MMSEISMIKAQEIAREFLSSLESELGVSLQLIVDETLERPFGWVFFYNSKEFLDTGDFRCTLAGNAPFFVDRVDGAITVTGTAKPIEDYIADYENRRNN